MIAIDTLSVVFGGVTALNTLTVTLDCPVVGIIGPNGAGKTTFLNVISGFVRPAVGTLNAFGTNLLALKPQERARWGLRRSFQKEEVVDELTLEDNVRVVLDPLGYGRTERDRLIDEALDCTGLGEVRGMRAAEANAFQRRMTELARCCAGKPKLILLDEPGAGFSQIEVHRLRAFIARLSDLYGAMVLLIDHDVELIQSTCPETMVLNFGSLIAKGPTKQVLTDDRVRQVYLGEAGQ